MDFLVRCPACGHSVSQHRADGCYGENLQCACLENHDGVMTSATSREAVTAGAPWSDESSAETA
jgi:hypothetical protein